MASTSSVQRMPLRVARVFVCAFVRNSRAYVCLCLRSDAVVCARLRNSGTDGWAQDLGSTGRGAAADPSTASLSVIVHAMWQHFQNVDGYDKKITSVILRCAVSRYDD